MTLLFFDFGSGEIFLIVLAIFLVFGPGKIPELARSAGKFINEIKRASEDVKNEINREADKIEREKKLEKYKKEIQDTKGNTKAGNENTKTAAKVAEQNNTTSEQVKNNDDDPEYIQNDTQVEEKGNSENIKIHAADKSISIKK